MKTAAKQLDDSCIDWEPKRGALLTDIPFILQMVKHPHYPTLGAGASSLYDAIGVVSKMVKALPKPDLVPADSIRECTRSAKRAVDTVVMTATLFSLQVEMKRVWASSSDVFLRA